MRRPTLILCLIAVGLSSTSEVVAQQIPPVAQPGQFELHSLEFVLRAMGIEPWVLYPVDSDSQATGPRHSAYRGHSLGYLSRNNGYKPHPSGAATPTPADMVQNRTPVPAATATQGPAATSTPVPNTTATPVPTTSVNPTATPDDGDDLPI